MKFAFHHKAKKELEESVLYYESCRLGLGLEFAEEVYSAINRICTYPDAWAILSKKTRHCLVNRFPYSIVYQHVNGSVRIIAIANLRRKPDYWQSRIHLFEE